MDQERLSLALAAAGMGEFEWDMVRDVFIVSPSLAAMTGLPAGEAPAMGGRLLNAFVPPDVDIDALREGALAGPDPYSAEFPYRRPDTGELAWFRVVSVKKVGPDGARIGVSGIFEDITRAKQEEEQRGVLMAELDHRVKNVLAAVQALAYQTAKRTASLDGFLQNFTGRLKALGSANELLTAARWRGAAVEHVAAAELGALAPGQTTWHGPELFLTPRATNALALALHELAANAVKFGALSAEGGHVDVAWAGMADGGFELIWTESGGPMVAPPRRRGFGSTLLEQVTPRELHGVTEVEYRPSGVWVRLTASRGALAQPPDSAPEAPIVVRPPEAIAAPRAPKSLKGARVLIVEDAVLLALELETGLSDAGAEVIGPAYELEEAIALLDRPIDAAVLDANLNGRSVAPVAEALAARKVPFVFATGYGETGGAPGGFEAPVIRKPYDVTQVAAAVAELLGAR